MKSFQSVNVSYCEFYPIRISWEFKQFSSSLVSYFTYPGNKWYNNFFFDLYRKYCPQSLHWPRMVGWYLDLGQCFPVETDKTVIIVLILTSYSLASKWGLRNIYFKCQVVSYINMTYAKSHFWSSQHNLEHMCMFPTFPTCVYFPALLPPNSFDRSYIFDWVHCRWCCWSPEGTFTRRNSKNIMG